MNSYLFFYIIKTGIELKSFDMTNNSRAYLLVNFGGPRTFCEVKPFLYSLLTDKDVVRTKIPLPFHDFLFKQIAKKRAKKVARDYVTIGYSQIFEDTETVAKALQKQLNRPIITFYRYLPSTHKKTLNSIEKLESDEIQVFPLFPHFTFATTGSCARFFLNHLSKKMIDKLHWIKSYATHPSFIRLIQKELQDFLKINSLKKQETVFLFSAHGLPKNFVDKGDFYETEMTTSFNRVMEGFPKILGRLAYQSKFGFKKWLRPYTIDVCREIHKWCKGRKNIVFVPLSFTSDHFETLFEIEKLYMPIIAKNGLRPYRLPSFNKNPEWIKTIATILENSTFFPTTKLVRKGIS